ncbi:MAG TPA: glycosyltransferase family 4 protein [Vicinamibacterales bacterium]|nr:glycosyltransferase family 4 protein [Vicinamibacterales bacterium]
MSRVLVVTSGLAFGSGGHLVIARSLAQALRDAGHEAEVRLMPQNRFGRQAAAYLSTWLTDVRVAQDGRAVDQVISFRFPSYAVRHPRHVCWLNHRMREYYDLWERFHATLTPAQRVKEGVRRRLIHAADRWLLTRNVTRVFAQSRTIQARLQRFGGIRSDVLYPPPPQRPYRCDEYGDFIFAVSRLTPLKRLDLLVRAMARPEAGGTRCIIGGDGESRTDLEALARSLGVDHRVRFVGELDVPQLVDYLARCRAVCFPAYDEDFGFVTVEAFASGKPVVTCTDSGGPAELVRDGVDGYVTAPTAEAMGTAIARLADDEQHARDLGAAARLAVQPMTWDAVVQRLVIV